MAAYAALVSVMHIIDQLQLHPRPPISLDHKEAQSLTEKVTFLQDFLERYSHVNSTEVDVLESRIADAAYAAEDVIESHIVDQILAGSTSNGEKISSIDFYRDMQIVIEDMDFIKKEAMEIKERMGVENQLHRSSSVSAGLLKSASREQNRTMVGLDDFLIEVMDKLTGGQPDRQIIPIVGMGGIGKTTLARNIYANQVVVEYFHSLVWATISQENNTREILLELLKSLESRESLSQMRDDQLGETLYKKLSGWRYLIVIDDIWDIKLWDELKFFFPNNYNGSRIILTTRLSKLAFQLTGSHGLEMNFLDEYTSWNLFCKIAFGKEDCPSELEAIGKEIAKKCKGLPLSIVVIGGILAKSEHTFQHWEHIAENLNSIVNLEDNELCLQILHTSYNQLPVHLKPCFLYVGIFPEDSEIHASELVKLWVAEGFLKPIGDKSFEEVAEVYLKELIDRNLIIVHKYSSNGKIKYCKIHDLLRDLCLREVRKQKFLCVMGVRSFNIPDDISTERRICIHKSASGKKYSPQILPGPRTASHARSLIWEYPELSPLFSFRLLRVSSMYRYMINDEEYSLEATFHQVNLRYIYLHKSSISFSGFPSSVSLLWNLQTLIVHNLAPVVMAPFEIWKMSLLRHVNIWLLQLPDPPSGNDDTVLENLQTLLYIYNLNCSEEVVKRIPNIKKLKMDYNKFDEGSPPDYCLNNLRHLRKLETLRCEFHPAYMQSHLAQRLTFPHSLKKLTLYGTQVHWEELTIVIGSLPLLEVLKLKGYSCTGPHWETVEGQFCSLKFLLIEQCHDLEDWTTDSTHFPRLEHLMLQYLDGLKEIPLCIGDIPTLQSIQLKYCSDSAIESAERILEEQEELGNVGLKVQVVRKEIPSCIGDTPMHKSIQLLIPTPRSI